MTEEWTDNLPKLLPSWQGCVANHYFLAKNKHACMTHRIPDYGGTGIDISVKENGSNCEVAKYGVDQVNFGSQTCALPFFSNRKAYLLQDPCLEHIKKQRKDFKEFCLKLQYARQKLNNRNTYRYRKDLLSSQKLVRNMCLSGQFEKISLSQSVVDIATIPQTVEVDQINFHYSGGCLSAFNKENESPILLHPSGSKLNRLAVTPLIQTSDPNQAFKPNESARTTVKLKGDCIQQIKSVFNGYCYVKQGSSCHFVNLANLSEIHHIECTKQNIIKNISPSPYIPMEFISVHEDGKIILNDVEESEILWETNHSLFSDKNIGGKPLASDFGSHPRSILYLDNKEVHAVDLRLKKSNRSSIFSCYHSSCYPMEHLLAMKRLSVNPFQHLVLSNNHLFLCDERYSLKPVLIWNHMLDASPLYCDIATYDTTPDSADVVILLGTQDTRELVSFAARTRQSQVQAVSLTPPLTLSSVTDWADSLRFHGQFVERSLINRISKPLVGVCAVPHSNKPAFTAFQVTSVGDVFYQDFRKGCDSKEERTYRVDMGCILPPPETILPRVSHLMDTPDKFEDIDDDLSTCNINRINVDVKEFLRAPKEISDWCVMCRSLVPNCDEKIVSNDVCPSCGLEKLQSDKLQKEYTELGLLIGPSRENSDIQSFDNREELERFTDHHSRRILDVWFPVEDASGANATTWEFNNSDFNFTAMSEASNTSYSSFTTPFRDPTTYSQPNDSRFLMQQSSQDLFEYETIPETQESIYSQELMEEVIPPSQDMRPKIGETLRKPKKSNILSKLNTSSAGF